MKLLLLGALLISLSAVATAAPPDLRGPREVLPGHWRDAADSLHYYVTNDQVLMISRGEPLGTFPYEVVEENRAELWVRIKLKSDEGALRTVRVDFKRKGFMETFTYKGVTLNNIMLYVDDKQAP